MHDLASSRRFSIAVAVEAALDAGAKLNMIELQIALAEWRCRETDDTVARYLDRMLERRKEAA